MEIGQAAIEGLDDGSIGKAMAEENGFSFVTFRVAGVEDEAGSGSEGFVRRRTSEAPGSWEPIALHGRHRAEVGLEFGGEEFDRAAFV